MNCVDRDKEFERIFKEYNYVCLYVANQYMQDEMEAEDIVSGAFLKLWNATDWSKPKSFLMTVIERDSLNRIKSLKRHEKDHEELAQLQQEVEAKEYMGDIVNMIRKELDKMSRRQKQACQLLLNDGLDVKAVSDKMGLSVDTVRVMKMRGFEKIKKSLIMEGIRIRPIIASVDWERISENMRSRATRTYLSYGK